jgi:hypothetical protein
LLLSIVQLLWGGVVILDNPYNPKCQVPKILGTFPNSMFFKTRITQPELGARLAAIRAHVWCLNPLSAASYAATRGEAPRPAFFLFSGGFVVALGVVGLVRVRALVTANADGRGGSRPASLAVISCVARWCVLCSALV